MMKNNSNRITIKEVLFVSRPVSWINTAAPFLVGYLITVQSFDITAIIGLLYFLFPYNLLMYGVNDIYDYESDIKNPRKNWLKARFYQKISTINFGLILYLSIYLL